MEPSLEFVHNLFSSEKKYRITHRHLQLDYNSDIYLQLRFIPADFQSHVLEDYFFATPSTRGFLSVSHFYLSAHSLAAQCIQRLPSRLSASVASSDNDLVFTRRRTRASSTAPAKLDFRLLLTLGEYNADRLSATYEFTAARENGRRIVISHGARSYPAALAPPAWRRKLGVRQSAMKAARNMGWGRKVEMAPRVLSIGARLRFDEAHSLRPVAGDVM